MRQSIRMTARRAELLRAFNESWRLGAEVLEPANKATAEDAAWLARASVLRFVAPLRYVPGPRWSEAVDLAHAFDTEDV